MREIKFRAWDGRSQKWYHRAMEWVFNKPHGSIGQHPIIPEGLHIMQYTGLKDKNGVGVYEGDIIAFSISDTQHYSGIVTWDDAMAKFYLQDRAFHMSTPEPHYQHKMEVTGNIYENPDLIDEPLS